MLPRAPAPPGPLQLPRRPPAWAEDEARLLQALREAAGRDEAVFAKANAISLAQLRALEGRGQSAFYSEDIKAQLGRRLLQRLGYTAEQAFAQATLPCQPPEATTPADGVQERNPDRPIG